jgi:hypothetical protein
MVSFNNLGIYLLNSHLCLIHLLGQTYNLTTFYIMALPVMEFQVQGYKIRKIFAKNQHTQRKLLNFEN